ncbi:MAG: hypothetical protein ACK47B_10950 [Armatimonadota bacterium]
MQPGFSFKHHSREQAEELWKAMLANVERQAMECYANGVMHPNDKQLKQAAEGAQAQLRRLEAEYERWQAENPAPAPPAPEA